LNFYIFCYAGPPLNQGLPMRFFYSLFFYLIMPLVLLRLWIKSFAAKAYAQRWKERFGFVEHSPSGKKVIWIHTVSVGEFLGALPLIRELQKLPDYSLHITTTTVTGSERVLSTLKDSVAHSYSPYDLPGSVSRFIKRVNPSMLIIMETELWPNWLAACRQKSIPGVLINARLSAKSAKGYARFSWLTKPMLQDLVFALVQQANDAERFYALGLAPEKTHITGNIKFDISLDEQLQQKAQQLKQDWDISSQRLVVMAASTHQG
jgi:3-deoxy-D-manno-octulosonic-acid transferase